MYPAPFHYHCPSTLDEAISLLSQYGSQARIIAGGQTLLPMLKMRIGDVAEIVDIGRLPNLAYIERRGASLHIGAATTYAEIASSKLVEDVALLHDCVSGIADKQVRNCGTIGGSLSVADPSGDLPAALRALDTQVICTGPNGARSVPVKDFIVDAYVTALDDNELVTEIKINLPAQQRAGAYIAFKRAAAAYPTATAAVQLTMKGDICEDVRLVLGAAGSTAITSPDAENLLRGQTLTDQLLTSAAEKIVEAASPAADARGSEAFKRAMLGSLLVEAVRRALARNQGKEIKGGHRYA